MDSQNEIESRLDNLIDEISIREHVERCEMFKEVAKDLFMLFMKQHQETMTISQCMDCAIDMAWDFSDRSLKKMREEYNKPDKPSDEDILKEVEDRGLIADVLFMNENLVESYGYVKKSETEF